MKTKSRKSNSGKIDMYRGPMGGRGPPMYYDGNGPSAGPYVGSDNGGFGGGGFGPTGGFGSAGSSNFGGFGNSDGSDRPKRTSCFNCGEVGHLSKDCTNPRRQRTEFYTLERPKRGCYNCGEEGHNSRECPKPPREPQVRGGGRGGFSGAFRGSGGDRPKRGGGYYNLSYPEDGAHSPRGGPKSREDTRRSWNHPRMSSIQGWGGGGGRGRGGAGGFSRFGPPNGNGDPSGFSGSANNCFGPGEGSFAGSGFGGGGFGPGPVAGALISTKSPGPYVNNGGFNSGPPPPPPFGGYHPPPAGFGSTNSVASKSDSGELGFGNGSRRGEPNSGGFGDSDDEQSAIAVPTSVKHTGPVGSNDAGFRFQGDLVFFAKDFAAGKPQGQLCSNCNSEWHLTKDCTNLRKSASSNISVPDDDVGDLRKSIMPKIERLCDDSGEICEKSLMTPGIGGAVANAIDKQQQQHHSADASNVPGNKPDLPATAPKSSQAPNSDIRQLVEQVDAEGKLERLTELLQSDIENCAPTSPEGKYAKKTLIFVERKRTADYLASVLSQRNVCSTSFHNDREQSQRDQAISDFKYGHCPVMVVNAISARSLDIVGVDHVINYDLPKLIDDYVHRVGRTGRTGSPGKATSFYDESSDGGLLKDLAKILTDAQQTVPDWMQNGGGGGGSFGFGSDRSITVNPIGGSESKPVVWC